MLEVVVGVTLTALLGGLLIPIVKGVLDRRSEQFNSSVALIDTLAISLWAMWTLAVRIASYGKLGQRGSADLDRALLRWNSDAAWQISCEIQVQVSKSKRLLSFPAQQALDQAQKKVVNFLTNEIDRLRQTGTPDDWGKFYEALIGEIRTEIDSLLGDVTQDSKVARTQKR